MPSRRITKKRGPKPKLISKRVLDQQSINSIVRVERTYSHRQKIRVLTYLEHQQIPLQRPGRFRKPTQQEAADKFQIPPRTISEWVKKRGEIEKVGINTKGRAPDPDIGNYSQCWWPELEEKLYSDFLEWREQGQIVRRGWFRVQAGFRFRELYPDRDPAGFQFSNGWFAGFLGRHRISLRSVTKKAQKVPVEYQTLVLNWLRFNRRNSQPRLTKFLETVLEPQVSRFLESNICNLDETPIPFEYLEGKTYDIKGEKTIWAKLSQNGWDKRQASLVLCVFADGIPRVPPMIIFRGKGERLGREREEYHPGVEVEFNDKAYMNDQLFLRYIDTYLIPALGGRPTLFALDLMGSHKTPAVLEKLRQHDIIPTMIPGGCTSLVQPLDVSINKPFKEIMRELTDTAIFEAESAEAFHRWSVRDRRILTTSCVGDAYYRFHLSKGDLIRRVFRKVGLSLPANGSCDAELDIKGFGDLVIGDWSNDYQVIDATADIPVDNDNDNTIEFV